MSLRLDNIYFLKQRIHKPRISDLIGELKGKHTLRVEHRRFTCASLTFMYSMKASPATASRRLIPDAIPCSEIILKARISAVLLTWVPPQSSIDTPGTSTTRTYNTSENIEKTKEKNMCSFPCCRSTLSNIKILGHPNCH